MGRWRLVLHCSTFATTGILDIYSLHLFQQKIFILIEFNYKMQLAATSHYSGIAISGKIVINFSICTVPILHKDQQCTIFVLDQPQI